MLTGSVNEVVLGRRQLYMLPTYNGWLFAGLLLVLLLAAINYGNGLVYALTFLLAAIAVASMLHTHGNLSRLRVRATAPTPVFAGETASFPVCVVNESEQPRWGVLIEHGDQTIAPLDIPGGGLACAQLTVTAPRRGYLAAPAFCISTRFPLGLLYSWSRRLTLESRCLVYPAPAENTTAVAHASEGAGESLGQRGPGDDFAGQREYRGGDSLRHVNWKALARGRGWLTKEFGGGSGGLVWFDWNDWPALDTEARLSALCRAVLGAEREGLNYGLRLPRDTIAPGSGEAHQATCLAALALFEG